MSPAPDVGWLVAEGGHRVPVRRWPLATARSVVQVLHGMAEHSGCYEDVAAALNAAGHAVVAHDHRGHGLAAAGGGLGEADPRAGWGGLLADAALVNADARRLHPGLPATVLGHSMGSFLALQLAQRSPGAADRLVLAGSSWEPPWFAALAGRLAALECLRQGEAGRSRLVHALTWGAFDRDVGGDGSGFAWISRDEAVVRRYVDDPWCGFQSSNGFWRDFLRDGLAEVFRPRAMRAVSSALPVSLCAGDRDPVGHRGRGPARLARELRRAGVRDVTLRLYPGARHDVLHEANREEVLRDLLGWLAPRPGAAARLA
jgi:alpha-beta hydrolase superfamily lysophospholipase